MFCQKCGCKIPQGSVVCPRCGTAPGATKFCQHCGSVIDKECVVCPKCGKQVAELRRVPERTTKPQRSASNFFAWVGFVLFVLFGVCFIPSVASAFFMLAALTVIPVESVQSQLKNIHISGSVKGIVVSFLFIIGTIVAPSSDALDNRNVKPVLDDASNMQSASTEKEQDTSNSASEEVSPTPQQPDPTQDIPQTSVSAGAQIYSSEDDPNQIWAHDFTPINDFYYSLDKSNQTITLNKYKKFGPKIMLSPVYTIDGVDYSLKNVGDACFFGKVSLKSVYIPEGVTSIASNAFNSCSDLQYLYLPSTLKSVTDTFLDYLNNYNIYCDSITDFPAERDTNNYEEIIDDRSQAEELGESAAGALNGLVSGFFDGMTETTIITEIYFGGTESHWKSIKK